MSRPRKPTPFDGFQADEVALIQSAARRVWDAIGMDCLVALADDRGSDVDRVTISRSQVLELVCDCDRLENQLRSMKRADLADRIHPMGTEIYALVKPGFPHTRYGM